MDSVTPLVGLKKNPTIDDMIALPVPEAVQISPDGGRMAYTVTTPDWEKNGYVSQIWMAGEGLVEPRPMTFARTSSDSPCWSTDGQWLAFTSKRGEDEAVQLYRMAATGGEAECLTAGSQDVESPAWSPDGSAIAFTALLPKTDAQRERVEQFGEYNVEDQDYQRSGLWLFRLADRQTILLAGGEDLHVREFRWSPDGRWIVFESMPTPDEQDWERRRLYRVAVETLALTSLTGEGFGNPCWSPDGAKIAAYQHALPAFYRNGHLVLLPAEGGDPQTLPLDFDEDPIPVHWGPQGIDIVAMLRTEMHLLRVNPDTGQVHQLTPPGLGWTIPGMTASVSLDGQTVGMVAADREHYAEVVRLDCRSGRLTRLTNFNRLLADWQLGRPEVFTWTSADGTPIEGVLIKPEGFDPQRAYPLLVMIHGGPTWAAYEGLLANNERRYYPLYQWVNRGALVLMPNYRGSSGYGEAFRSLNVRNLGIGDAEDVISGVDALVARGWVDPQRVGSMGWSQGGYISAFLTTTSDRFKAISVGAGISNWVTYYTNTDIHPFTRQYLGATPWEDAEIYARTSPMTYIHQAKTPTLIQHGEKDHRVPIPNAYELYQGLQDMGVETRLVVYKDTPHGVRLPCLHREVMQENLDWFNRWIWGDEPPVPQAAPCYVALGYGELDPTGEEIRAIERHRAKTIQDVYHWARRDGAQMRIFSGQIGLLRPEDPLPFYDHRLAASEVSSMAARLAGQIRSQGLKKLVLYTPTLQKHPWAMVYLGCLLVAAGLLEGVQVEYLETVGDESPAK